MITITESELEEKLQDLFKGCGPRCSSILTILTELNEEIELAKSAPKQALLI